MNTNTATDAPVAMGTRSQSTSSSSSSSSQSVNLIDKIKSDHRTVEMLYQRFQSTPATEIDTKNSIKADIIKELCIHAACEEMVLYPAVNKFVNGSKSKDGETLAQHSLEEHREMKQGLYDLEQIDHNNITAITAKLDQVMADVMHHVKEEESELLPALEKSVTQQQLYDFGSSFFT